MLFLETLVRVSIRFLDLLEIMMLDPDERLCVIIFHCHTQYALGTTLDTCLVPGLLNQIWYRELRVSYVFVVSSVWDRSEMEHYRRR